MLRIIKLDGIGVAETEILFMYVSDCAALCIHIVISANEITFCSPSHEILIEIYAE